MALWSTKTEFGIRRDVHISSFQTDQKFTVSFINEIIDSLDHRTSPLRRNMLSKSVWMIFIGK